MKLIKFDFETKTTNKGLIIEGYGNANIHDRLNERIEPKGWMLENYKKNPVILFDHGQDMAFGSMPIGKAIETDPQEKGLYIKAKISESKTEKITAIRDLIEEGILKTFSVGFNPIGDQEKSDNGGTVIKSAELIECSVVPVPMNQDSIFSVSSRSFKSAIASDWFSRYAKVHDLYKKGARFAAVITDHIRKSGQDFPTVMGLLKNAGLSEDRALSILDGHEITLEKDVIELFSKTLGIEVTVFDAITLKGDDMAENEKPKENSEEMQKEGCKEPPAKKELSDDDMKQAMTEMHDQAVACANDSEGNPASWVADEEAWQKAKDAADKTYSREDPEKYYSVVTWLYLNRFGGTIKEPKKSENADGEKSAVASATKQAMPTGDNAVPPDQNPYFELAKQTNVLLSSVIVELQKMNMKMEKMVEGELETEEKPNPENETPPPSQEESNKNIIAKIQKAHDDLRKRIERMSA